MRVKRMTRNIPESRVDTNDRFRVKYTNKSEFDILEVQINRSETGESQLFTFKSSDLPDRDSIYFTTRLSGGRLVVSWTGVRSTHYQQQAVPRANRSGPACRETDGLSESLSPVVGMGTKVLVLGTMPGAESLRQQKYYANSRNLFWQIVCSLAGRTVSSSYTERVEFVKMLGISLWDICAQARRKGSLDSAIQDVIPNDLEAFIDAHPTISTIVFNGRKSQQLYDRHFRRRQDITYETCLSTSPANASYAFEEKMADWRSALAGPLELE